MSVNAPPLPRIAPLVDATTHYRAITVIPPPRVRRRALIRQIIAQVARKHRLTENDILAHRRNAFVALARHEAMYRAANETTHSLVTIGAILDRDPTTVLHGVRAHAARHGLPTPPAFKERQT